MAVVLTKPVGYRYHFFYDAYLSQPYFITNLAGDTTFINTLTADSLFIAKLDSLDDDNQNLTSFTLTGTKLRWI